LVMLPLTPCVTSGEQVKRALAERRSFPLGALLYQTMQLFTVPPYIPPPEVAEFPLIVQLFAVPK
jgi:hypothetical protein